MKPLIDRNRVWSKEIPKAMPLNDGETMFYLRLKSALVKKMSIELTKMMKKVTVLIKNIVNRNKHSTIKTTPK